MTTLKKLLPFPGISSSKLLFNGLKSTVDCSRLLLNHTQKVSTNINVSISFRTLLTSRLRFTSKDISICYQQVRHYHQLKPQQDNAKKEPESTSTTTFRDPKNTKIQLPLTIRENVYTIPNILTFTRLGTAPLIGYLITQSNPTLTVSVFAYSCITDFLDGYIARKYKMGSVLGSVIDPMADKLLMVISTVALSISGGMPLYLASAILGRDIMLGCMAFYIRYISLPLPKTFKRYWDFSIPSVEVHPTMISKMNTVLQMIYIGACIVNPVLFGYVSADTGSLIENSMGWFGLLVFSTTVWSGASYVFGANKFKILKNGKK